MKISPKYKEYDYLFKSAKHLKSYLVIITRFLDDPLFSWENKEDVAFLGRLLFEPKVGQIHQLYTSYVCQEWIKKQDPYFCTHMGRYANYLGAFEYNYLDSLFYSLLGFNKPEFVQSAFSQMLPDILRKFSNYLTFYPQALDKMPLIQSILLFL